jgi:hypothetical protein
MAGQPKVNGLTTAGAFYGYTPTFYLITGTDVGTADVASVDGVAAFTQGNASKAIRAIQTQMSIVFIGPLSDNGFVVAVDAPSANAYATSNADTDVAAAIDALVTAATSVSTTVVAKTLTLANFA